MAFMMGYYYSPWMWGLGLFLNILFWVALIWFIVWIVRHGSHSPMGMIKTPQEIIKLRYAKGEITKKEFEEMKKDLEK